MARTTQILGLQEPTQNHRNHSRRGGRRAWRLGTVSASKGRAGMCTPPPGYGTDTEDSHTHVHRAFCSISSRLQHKHQDTASGRRRDDGAQELGRYYAWLFNPPIPARQELIRKAAILAKSGWNYSVVEGSWKTKGMRTTLKGGGGAACNSWTLYLLIS